MLFLGLLFLGRSLGVPRVCLCCSRVFSTLHLFLLYLLSKATNDRKTLDWAQSSLLFRLGGWVGGWVGVFVEIKAILNSS